MIRLRYLADPSFFSRFPPHVLTRQTGTTITNGDQHPPTNKWTTTIQLNQYQTPPSGPLPSPEWATAILLLRMGHHRHPLSGPPPSSRWTTIIQVGHHHHPPLSGPPLSSEWSTILRVGHHHPPPWCGPPPSSSSKCATILQVGHHHHHLDYYHPPPIAVLLFRLSLPTDTSHRQREGSSATKTLTFGLFFIHLKHCFSNSM